MILRLRGKCFDYEAGQIELDDLRLAAWKVHQMLRADLGVAQPGLNSVLQQLRLKASLMETREDIEKLAAAIRHVEWPRSLPKA
jgi:selenocysteine lyase/cysteine desulfurase